MGIIKIENIRVFAHHGCLREETKIGSDYRVDLEIKAKHGKVIHWTTEEVLEFKFKRSYLSKIIKAIQTRKISLNPLSTESITNILNLKY